MRNEHFETVFAGIGVLEIGVELYRHVDLCWLQLWVLVAFWIGYFIAKETPDAR